MRMVILGANGQLGTALRTRLDGALAWTRADVDVLDFAVLHAKLDAARPGMVVNCTAYNFVDKAEQEPEAAVKANALAVRAMAQWCVANDAAFVHVSTDYVFGTPGSVPWKETDPPMPGGVYAVSKLAGEHYARIAPKHFIVRTCGLYGFRISEGGKGTNFVETMLKLAGQGKPLKVVDDQHCTPSFVEDVADGITALISTRAYGLYHITNAGATTWYKLAKAAFEIAGISANLEPTTTEAYVSQFPPDKRPAPRPSYSVLDCSKFTAATGMAAPPWRDALARYLAERTRKAS